MSLGWVPPKTDTIAVPDLLKVTDGVPSGSTTVVISGQTHLSLVTLVVERNDYPAERRGRVTAISNNTEVAGVCDWSDDLKGKRGDGAAGKRRLIDGRPGVAGNKVAGTRDEGDVLADVRGNH